MAKVMLELKEVMHPGCARQASSADEEGTFAGLSFNKEGWGRTLACHFNNFSLFLWRSNSSCRI